MRTEFRTALSLLSAALLFGCSGDGNGPEAVSSVTISPPTASVEVGATQAFTATARDADGDVLSGRSFTWSSSASGTAGVSTSGVATGVAPGTALIRASTGGVTGSAQLTVTAPGPASVLITPDSADVAVGQTVQLTATVLDGNGDPVSAGVAWSSANTSTATVDGSGLVMGQAEGKTQVTASAGTVQSAPATIVVVPPGNVIVSSIDPNPMVEGQTATITGEGFSANPVNNTVTINGFAAPVTSASETQLVIGVPAECFPAGNVTLAISTPTGSSGAVLHPMQPAKAPLSMAVGEFMLIQNPADFCLQFGPELLNEEYAFGVQSVLEDVTSLTDARVRGQVPAGVAGVNATALPRPTTSFPPAGAVRPTFDRARAAHRVAEAELRRKEAALVRALPVDAPRRGVGAAARSSAIPDTLIVGDTLEMRVPNINGTDFCNDFATVDAVVRVVGARGIWLEDATNPAGGLSLAQIQTLSDLLDDQIHAVNVAWFGDFTDFDENERVAVLISREVNALANVLGFVVTTDLIPGAFPGQSCASSNDGEVYYSITPDAGGSLGGPALDAQTLFQESPALIAHELTHVIQFGRRFLQIPFPGIMTAWEAESQATFAEEVNGYVDTGRSPGQNYGPDVALPADGSIGTNWHNFGFTTIALYQGWDGSNPANVSIAGAPEQCAWALDFDDPDVGPCLNGSVLAYMMWLFHRWISDNVAGSEAAAQAIQRALIDNDLAGFANVEDVVGEPIETLLGQWAAMLYADDRSASLDARVRMPSWDLPAIFGGTTDPSTRLEPHAFGFAAFSSDVRVRGGSSAYYLVSGLNRPHTAIRARALSGVPLPGFSQMWIVRLQ